MLDADVLIVYWKQQHSGLIFTKFVKLLYQPTLD